jgi:hypothetical protein
VVADASGLALDAIDPAFAIRSPPAPACTPTARLGCRTAVEMPCTSLLALMNAAVAVVLAAADPWSVAETEPLTTIRFSPSPASMPMAEDSALTEDLALPSTNSRPACTSEAELAAKSAVTSTTPCSKSTSLSSPPPAAMPIAVVCAVTVAAVLVAPNTELAPPPALGVAFASTVSEPSL